MFFGWPEDRSYPYPRPHSATTRGRPVSASASLMLLWQQNKFIAASITRANLSGWLVGFVEASPRRAGTCSRRACAPCSRSDATRCVVDAATSAGHPHHTLTRTLGAAYETCRCMVSGRDARNLLARLLVGQAAATAAAAAAARGSILTITSMPAGARRTIYSATVRQLDSHWKG